MEVDHLLAWFAHAQPGGSWTRYAVGPGSLDQSHATVRQVTEWVGAGVAEHEARTLGDAFEFVVRRAPAVMVMADRAVRGGPGADRDEMIDRDLAALALLETAARHGQPRPSYTMLGKALGLRDRQAARHVLERLRKAGLIERIGEGQKHSLRIVSSGAILAPAVDGPASPSAPQPRGGAVLGPADTS